jgi:uncharacterized membrane protein HdeD (DUF308 family)
MNEITEAATSGARKTTIFGIIVMILGVLALLSPSVTGLTIATAVGFLVVTAGILRMIWAFGAGSLGGGLVVFAIGALTLLCGIALVSHPMFASGLLTFLLIGYFILDGIFELVVAFKIKPATGWGFVLVGGIVSIVLGIMMWRQFPIAGAWAIGVLLGIKLIFVGLIMVTAGSAIKSLARD